MNRLKSATYSVLGQRFERAAPYYRKVGRSPWSAADALVGLLVKQI
jgi:hypothetical protein